MQHTLLWLAFWLPAVDEGRGSKSVEVQRVWEVYDDRLQFMSWQDAQRLNESLHAGDVSRAWLVWSGAAEAALADAFRVSGGPVPSRGLVLGRGSALLHVVPLGGPLVREGVRGLAADAGYGPGVFLYRDSSIAPLLNLRRRFKAVMDVLGANIRCGVSPARSVELLVQWERILAVGPLYPVTFDDLNIARGLGLGDFHRVASDAHRRLNDFIHQVVFHRRDEAIRGWRNWIRRTFWYIPLSGSGLIWFPPAPFLQCDPHLTPGGSGVLADPARIDEEIRKAWLPYFCRSGQREASFEEIRCGVGWVASAFA